jgi:hypothetical protein
MQIEYQGVLALSLSYLAVYMLGLSCLDGEHCLGNLYLGSLGRILL